MRPEVLFPLFAPATALNGVGPKMAKSLEKLNISKVADFFWAHPVGLIDRRYAPQLVDARPGRVATLTVRVDEHRAGASKRQPYRVFCSDDTGVLELVFFHARGDYLGRVLPIGETVVVSGQLDQYGGHLQMTHPDHIITPKEAESVMRVEPVYPLTAGVTLKMMAKGVASALEKLPDLPEWQDSAFLARQNWSPFSTAVRHLHAPRDGADIAPDAPARARLAYDELLANQLALGLVRRSLRRAKGRPLPASGLLLAKLRALLPFPLTGSQEAAIRDIAADLASDERMLRLLQGDVGSGKTLVALAALLQAVEAGCQGALMVPTEILARQHLATLTPLCEALGVPLDLLTGREKGKVRQGVLDRLGSGETKIIIGTHALFQEGVDFQDLGLVVIDEQHRFGVHQRLTLADKGRGVDVLVMTATPIPRTLMLTSYGDMETSRLTEKPAGRQPVDTRVMPADRLGEVMAGIGRALDAGAKVYWICPLVEANEQLDLAAAEDRALDLRHAFGDARVGLVHGRMKGKGKDAVMEAFINGPVDLLVATTVIEVGVDVPAATVMVIEHAERFGLAQLHQLRGRIGRGSGKSTC
ncbi:MAG: ATP-dependent DNA helicase RecG, partial [Rhodospirillales bacterium]